MRKKDAIIDDMTFVEFTAGTDDNDRRLDKIARKFLSDQNLSQLYKAIRSGLIKINKKKAKAEQHVFPGDVISIADFLLSGNTDTHADKNTSTIKQEKILFRNEHILILNKPYDVSVQKSNATDTSLADMVQQDYANTSQTSSLSFKTGPLHRLDRKTTGIIAFSQSLEGARFFSKAIKEHSIKKTYLAILQGNFTHSQEWQDNIEKTQNARGFRTVKAGEDEGKLAITTAIPLAHGTFQGTPVTLVQLNIKTGRTHQIRSQSALHGHPLIGDTAYGGKKLPSVLGRDFFLHATYISIPDNKIGLPPSIECQPGKEFKDFLHQALINWNSRLIF